MGAAAAVIMMRERRLVEAFTLAAATSPERALPVETLGVDYDALALRRLQQRAVIREGAPGRFYLDVPSRQALWRMRRRVGFLVIAVVMFVASLLLFTQSGGPPLVGPF